MENPKLAESDSYHSSVSSNHQFRGKHLYRTATSELLISSVSDYQGAALEPQGPSKTSELELELGCLEPSSRPLSRNLTTSCLSTTATKDGVAGNKFKRAYHPPLAVLLQAVQLPKPASHSQHATSPMAVDPMGDDLNTENMELHNQNFRLAFDFESAVYKDQESNYSQVSLKSTNAQLDGDTGASSHLNHMSAIPSVTLREKITLMEAGRAPQMDQTAGPE